MSREQNLQRTSGLLRLFFPLLLMTVSNSLFLLIEKLFLARLSPDAMQAALASAYVCQVFQLASVALVMMAQVFVARWIGANQNSQVGSGIWQFIWFSLLSTLLTVPATLLYGKYYFQTTSIATTAQPYFYFLTGIGFLYPLSTTLICFFLGQQKTRLIFWTTLAAQACKILLGYCLIFGYGPFPAFGLMGGALSTLIAQGGFCGVLFAVFLNTQNRKIFATHKWNFRWILFRECITPGILRSINRIASFTAWVATTYLLNKRGGDYALVLSVGGSLFLFLPCFFEALCNAQTSITAQHLGARRTSDLPAAFRSSYLLACSICGLMAIPFLLFPQFTFSCLFPTLALPSSQIVSLFLGLFLSFVFIILSAIPISTVLAFKDMTFSLCMGSISWLTGFLPTLYLLNVVQMPAEHFWLSLSAMHAINLALYLARARVLCSRQKKCHLDDTSKRHPLTSS